MALQSPLFPELESPDFIYSEEVTEVAADVLGRHGHVGSKAGVARLRPVAEALENGELHIVYLSNTKPLAEGEDPSKHDVAAKCVKAPRLWHDVTGVDVAIWVREAVWTGLDEQSRHGVLLHELLHVEVTRDKDDQVMLAVRKHDVEDFTDVIRHYGPIAGDAASYVRAAAAFSGQPEPLHPQFNALQGLANDAEMDITISGGGKSRTLHGRPAVEPPADVRALYGNLVRQGEALEQALHRVADDTEAIGTPEGQRLLEVVNQGGGAEIPWPSE